MKQHISFAGKLFLNRMFFNVITLVVLPIFIAMIDGLGVVGRILFAAVICSLYLGIQMDLVWKLGKHDRQFPDSGHPYAMKGFCVAALAEVPFLIVYLFLVLSGGATGLRALYRTLCIAPYMSLVPENQVNIGYLLVLLIAPLFSLFPYIIGIRDSKERSNKSLRDKIMYKN